MSWQPLGRPGFPPTPRTTAGTHLFVAAGIGLMFGLVVYLAGAPVPRVFGAGLVLGAGSFSLLRAMEIGRVEWPIPPRSRGVRVDGLQRWRLNGFEALTDRRPGFSYDLRIRLSALATAMLTRRRLTPGSPGAIDLLGPDTHQLLFPPVRAEGDPPPSDPTGDQLTAMIDRLIELGRK